MGRLSPLFLVAVTACSSAPKLEDPDEIPLRVSQRCPGDPSCPDVGDGRLYAGAARRDLTPDVEPFTDQNQNGHWDDGEPFTDKNGNGVFDAYWIAGFGNNRIATGVHDPIWVRAWALKQNATTVVFFVVDAVGFFYDDLKAVRALVDPALEVDLVVSSATHVHEAVDTTGGWGVDETTSGINHGFQDRMHTLCAEAIAEAVHNLRPARLTAGSIPVVGPNQDLTPYVSDTRNPTVIDPRLHLLQFDGADDGKPIVAVVNWAAHPEAVGSHNPLLSSDFVHWVRAELEPRGGEVVYVSGAVGGQIGPGEIEPIADDGTVMKKHDFGFPFAEAWGRSVARFALDALDAHKGADVIADAAPKLSFRTTRFNVHVDNTRYVVAGQLGVFDRPFFGFDKKKPPRGANAPLLDTEEAYLRIGDHVSIITVGGELLPELFLGGYDGSAAYSWPFLEPGGMPNAPDPAKAPRPPYLRDVMDGDVNHRMVFGLSLDFLGYIVPRYNFVVDPALPYLKEAEGDHYEETNSLGVRAAPELVGTARQLILDGRSIEDWRKGHE